SLDNNREVFSIPHNITSKNGIGPNSLLKQGAHPVTTAKDILEVLSLDHIEKFVENKIILPDSPIEAKLLEHLSREALHVDELRKKTGLASHEINSTLTLMEMKGKVRNLGGMNYVTSR
ncbi:MAG: DNA-protecting protein DprA, partial [Candidatus Magasanikbacteria bacterium]